MTLFRKEAYEQAVNHHHGDALITVPLAWTAITLFIGVSVLAAFAFAASVSYSRVQVVTGVITPENGGVPRVRRTPPSLKVRPAHRPPG